MAAVDRDAEVPAAMAGTDDGGSRDCSRLAVHHHCPGRRRVGVIHHLRLVPVESVQLVQRLRPLERSKATPGRERCCNDGSGERRVMAESVPGSSDDLVDIGLGAVRSAEGAQPRIEGRPEVVVLLRQRIVGVVDDRVAGLALAGQVDRCVVRRFRLTDRHRQVELGLKRGSVEEAESTREQCGAE